MYKDGYVVTVRQNNNTIPEENGKCIIPFHTEYEIRLRNKTRRRALADVFINGELATKGGLIINANDHIDLERFIGNDLNKGDRFKLVPLADYRVEDKSEPSNGEIEVVFYPEKEYEAPKETHHHHHHHDYWHHHCCPRQCWSCGKYHCSCQYCIPTWNVNFTTNGGMIGGCTTTSAGYSSKGISYSSSLGETLGSNNQSFSIPVNMSRMASDGEAGATVHGSLSNQSFNTGYIDVDKTRETRIRLKILGRVGTSIEKNPKGEEYAQYCSNCGNHAGIFDRFCFKCGKELQKIG